jgi:DJ-1/PfpI family
MAGETLQGMKVAVLVTDGFEQVELTEPRKALDQAGASAHVVSPGDDKVRRCNFTDWGQSVPVDRKLDEVRPQDFDALLVRGGVINPGQAQNGTKGSGVCEGLLRLRQAGGGDLPWALDDRRSRQGTRPRECSLKFEDYLVHGQAVARIGADAPDPPVALGSQHIFHLHCLDDGERFSGLDLLARRDIDCRKQAGHR